eukprot:m.33754 g.33754  ORF g.33754 m.33754 type:complete len:61 (+) comp9661_c0_seq1:317-499(+)
MLSKLNFALAQGTKAMPALVGYGAAAGLAVVYLTDKWFSKPVLAAIPWVGAPYQTVEEEK